MDRLTSESVSSSVEGVAFRGTYLLKGILSHSRKHTQAHGATICNYLSLLCVLKISVQTGGGDSRWQRARILKVLKPVSTR